MADELKRKIFINKKTEQRSITLPKKLFRGKKNSKKVKLKILGFE